MSKDIQAADALAAFLQGGGSYTAALQALLRTEDAKLTETRKKETIASRKEAIRKAIEHYDVEKLVELHDKMESYIDKMVRPVVTEPRQLTADEARTFMVEYLSRRELEEFLKVRYEDIRKLVLMSIDEDLKAQGKDPDVTNGELPVPELGKVFKKQGAGRKEPGLDEDHLLGLLGDMAAEVQEEVHVPARTETVLSHEKLLRLAQQKPEVMEMIRESLIPGDLKTPKFTVADIKE